MKSVPLVSVLFDTDDDDSLVPVEEVLMKLDVIAADAEDEDTAAADDDEFLLDVIDVDMTTAAGAGGDNARTVPSVWNT